MISILDALILLMTGLILIYAWVYYISQKELKKTQGEHNKKANDLQMRVSRLFDENKRINQTYQETAEKLKALEIIRTNLNLENNKLEQRISKLQHELYCARKRSKKLVNMTSPSIK